MKDIKQIKLNRIKSIEAGSLHYQGGVCARGHDGIRYTKTKACVACTAEQGAARKRDNADRERARLAAWRQANPDKRREERKRYRARHAQEIRERHKDYRQRDPNGTIALRRSMSAFDAAIRKEERAIHREETREEREAAARARTRERYQNDMFIETPQQRDIRLQKDRQRKVKYRAANPELYRMSQRIKKARRRAQIRGTVCAATRVEIMQLAEWQDYKCAYCGVCLRENLSELDHKNPLSRGGEHTLENLQWLCKPHNQDKRARTDSEYRLICGIPEHTIWDAI